MSTRIALLLLSFIASIVVLLSLQSPIDAASKPLSVCELLEHLSKYRGRTVEVRGQFGGTLRGECAPLKTGNYTWISEIDLEFPSNIDPKDEEGKANWKFDIASYKAAIDHVSVMQRAAPGKRIYATLKGRFDTPENLDVWTVGGPYPVPLGYGHLGVYPARLVLKAIQKLEYEDKSPLPNFEIRPVEPEPPVINIESGFR